MLKFKRVTLRALEREDLETVWRWHNDPAVTHAILGQPHHVTSMARLEKEFEKSLKRTDRREYIVENEAGVAIGIASYQDLDAKNRSAGLGILIGESGERRKGYAREAITALLAALFDHMNLHRVWAVTVDYNGPAVKALQGCGFKREGAEREAVFVDGRYHDKLILGILREEFRASEHDSALQGR